MPRLGTPRTAVLTLALLLGLGLAGPAAADQVIPDDLIVQGSECVGFDCVNGENFQFDTIRLKENNLRITFIDTSVGSFPSGDWQLRANDSASGGQNRFTIDWLGTGAASGQSIVTTPFTVEGAAPTNTLYLDSTGRVGFRTSNPVLDLHVATSNTPALRLEQTSAGGFTAQTWDMAGNEANFFIRDVTGGSRLPFRIRPGAPTSSIDISADGDVGIGTASPGAPLHVQRNSGATTNNTLFQVEDTSTTTGARFLMDLKNNGPTRFRIQNTALATGSWAFSVSGANQFVIDELSAGGAELSLDAAGQLTVNSCNGCTTPSSASLKADIVPVDRAALLARLSELPVATWRYKDAEPSARHIGPMAEDFHATFGFGKDNKHIHPMDTAGVALAAIQELHRMVKERDDRLAELQARVSLLEEMLARVLKTQAQNSIPSAGSASQ